MVKLGWQKSTGSEWSKKFLQEVKMPVIDRVRMKGRIVMDLDTGVLMESLMMGPATKPPQIRRNLRRPRNLDVVMEFEVEGNAEDRWEDQPMARKEASKLRALAARWNYRQAQRTDKQQHPIREILA